MDTLQFDIFEGRFHFCSREVDPSVLKLMANITIMDNEGPFGNKIAIGYIAEDKAMKILAKEAYSMAGMDSYILALCKAVVFSNDESVHACHHVVYGGRYEFGRGFFLKLHQDSCRRELPEISKGIKKYVEA